MRLLPPALLDLLFPPRCIYCNALVHSSQNLTCPHCTDHLSWIGKKDALQSGAHFSCCVSAAWYEGEIRRAFLQFKFFKKRRYAETFALPLAQAIAGHLENRYDLISWIPLSEETLKTRGYDQALLLASAAARLLHQNLLPLFVHSFRKTPQSTLSSASARRQNIKGSFTLLHSVPVQGMRILLIDDVITTGSTLEECARLLLDAGAKEVLCATFCRTPLSAS